MGELLAFAFNGSASGALIAGLALGVVLNYRGCGAINVGLGAVATLSAYFFYGLRGQGVIFLPPIAGFDHIKLGGPWGLVPALVVTLLFCAAIGALFDVIIFRPLRNAPAMSKLIATVGMMVAIQALVVLHFGSTAQLGTPVLPGIDHSVTIGDTPVSINRFILLGIVAAVTVPLIVIYRRTRFGLATRAAAENEQSALLHGHSPNRLSLINTTLAFTLVGFLGIIVAPLIKLDSSTITLSIVPALAAALIAGFTSFGVAATAGVLIGMGESIITYLQTMTWFPTSHGVPIQGIADVLILLVIIVTLLTRGKSLPQRGALIAERLPRSPLPKNAGRTALIAAVAVVLLLTFVVGARQSLITSVIAFVTVLPFTILVGYVGQLSVAQLAFAGISGLITSRVCVEWGLGFPFGPIIAVIVATVVGTLLAVPALRVRGVNLAILTIAVAVAIGNFGFGNSAWGARPQGDPVEQPSLFGIHFGTNASFPIGDGKPPSPVFGFFCVVVALVVGLLVVNLRRSHLGKWMLAVRGNERAAASATLSVPAVKITAFALSAAVAGIAGVLYAYNFSSVSTERYELASGLSFLAFAYIAGVGSVGGALMAAVMAVSGIGFLVVNLVIPVSDTWQAAVGGLLLMLMVTKTPDGIVNAPGSKKIPPPFNWIFDGAVWAYHRWRPDRPAEPEAEPSKQEVVAR
ncbi:ABC transporter permease [Nocardia miyunensis]|uniref:ABC transporter permease n=1 Tax=Nocardia miyunensis TaxID=282684 RepID=UPI000A97EFB7|nr:ABC transporter permease [Nocardia miyunensis]